MKVYFAAPLFNEMERRRNIEECAKIEAAGHSVYLPQRDGGIVDRKNACSREVYVAFHTDLANLEAAECVIAYLDGRAMDEGTVFEIGFAFARKIPTVVVYTDDRAPENGFHNIMLERTCEWFKTTEQALEYVKQLEEIEC